MFDWCQIFYLCANESMKINIQITEMCWIVTKSYWSSFICTGQELDFLNFYINKFTCAIHFFHQMVDLHFDPQHAFGVSVQFVIRGSLKW